MEEKKEWVQNNIDSIIVFVISATLFWALINYSETDVQLHIQSIININAGQSSYPPHFMFFFLVNLLSFFSNNVSLMFLAAIIIFSSANVVKYVVSKKVILDIITNSTYEYKCRVVKIVCFAMLFSFALPDIYNFFILKKMYLGRYPSVVWHNSTITLLFPFALLLFWKQFKIIHHKNLKTFNRNVFLCCLLVIINISIKPSFIFVFAPVSMFLIYQGVDLSNFKRSIMLSIPTLVAVVLLGVQYIGIYHFEIGSFYTAKSSVAISKPFEFVRIFIPLWYTPIAIVMSFGLPISAIIAYKNDILKFKPFLYSLYLTILGVLISAFIIEEGPRKFAGNFTWQNIICSYLMLMTTTAFLLKKFFKERQYSNKMIFLGVVFILHFLSGMLYLVKIHFSGNYY
ncbi:hypothetical protein [uncultured Aquimarina sp.]|uniref:hypothetical protein n=1 Tax=uncultured Aquimarina sp. TaxID=575652 RepID=UPI00262B5A8E|nr:hypothetical protein [uncultured Aquimarina sp.]